MNMAIFIDGINDSFFKEGLPATHGIYREAIRNMNYKNSILSRNIYRSKINYHFLELFLKDLPLFKLIDILIDRFSNDNAIISSNSKKLSVPEIISIIDNYLFNIRSINQLTNLTKLKANFFWQPTPFYKYNNIDLHKKLSKWEDQFYIGHQNANDVYETFSKIKKPKNFYWLADMQKKESKNLYLDSIHYNNYFSKKIASEIFKKIKSQIQK